MIKCVCRTNLDDYKRCVWPTCLVSVPRIDERVQDKDGLSLKVVGITYFSVVQADGHDIVERPAVIVELNK